MCKRFHPGRHALMAKVKIQKMAKL